ncbi:MAG: tetratricopeptide repeat protein [Rhizobiaceae bacterium]|nr:tetratricopeptide repeat protein [Rhizobiaceae bacterium]
MAASINQRKAPSPKHISAEQAVWIAKRHEKRGEIQEARALYAQLLQSFPDHPVAKARLRALQPAQPKLADPHADVADALQRLALSDLPAAVKRCESLLLEYPNSPFLYSLLGALSSQLGNLDQAELCALKFIEMQPARAMGHLNLGKVLQDMGRIDEAIAAMAKGLALEPGNAAAHCALGKLFQRKGDLQRAFQAWDAASAIDPTNAEPYINRGVALSDGGQYASAIHFLNLGLSFAPDHELGWEGLCHCYVRMNEIEDAIEVCERALKINPLNSNVRSMKLMAQAQICDLTSIAATPLSDDLTVFEALSLEDDPERQLKRSQVTWQRYAGHIKPIPLPARPVTRPAKLRIGYFSADFHDHATMHLMSGLLREHDQTRFEIHLFSYGHEKATHHRKLLTEQGLIRHDVVAMSDEQIVALARNAQIDVAVDVKGFTSGSRANLFAYRLAPVQISYLAYPGSLGAPCFDYILADPIVIPEEYRPFYTEKVLAMPHSYQPNDNATRPATIKTSRSDHGLPEKGVVLACFNASNKIGFREFDIWMRVLSRIEGSALWLVRSNSEMDKYVRLEAEKRNISPERIVLSDKVFHAFHLERHRHADIFVDTFNYNAHTTASDSLWAGLPLVTKAGKQFSARVAASILNAVGMSDLITHTEAEYEKRIMELASNPGALLEVKTRLTRNLQTEPLFDPRRYARNIETGFELAYERYFAGEAPDHINVPDIGKLN